MTIDLLKRPAVFGTVGGVILLLIVWWFAWMSPEGNKLSGVNAQNGALQNQIAQLNTTITGLKQESALVPAELPYLARFSNAIPDLPESGVLTEQLYNLMNSTKTFISSLSDSTTVSASQAAATNPSGSTSSAAGSNTSGLTTIPVSLIVSGSQSAIVAFLQGLYTLPRLVTVQNVTLTPAGTSVDILQPSGTPGFSASISATAYTTFVPPAPTAATP